MPVHPLRMSLIAEIMNLAKPAKPPKGKNSAADHTEFSSLQAALARMDAERSAAAATIAAAGERRRSLLLADDDVGVDELEREIDQHHRTLERLDLLEPQLLRRLDELRSEARRERLAAYLQKLADATAPFIAALRETLRARDALLALRSEAGAAGFATEFGRFGMVPPVMMDTLAIDRFEVEWERAFEVLQRQANRA